MTREHCAWEGFVRIGQQYSCLLGWTSPGLFELAKKMPTTRLRLTHNSGGHTMTHQGIHKAYTGMLWHPLCDSHGNTIVKTIVNNIAIPWQHRWQPEALSCTRWMFWGMLQARSSCWSVIVIRNGALSMNLLKGWNVPVFSVNSFAVYCTISLSSSLINWCNQF